MSLAARTNQCIYFTRLTLEQVSDQSDAQTKQRLEEAAVGHLFSALNAYCNEVAKQYQLPPFSDISDLLREDDLVMEIAELKLLHEVTESWFSQILMAHQKVITEGLSVGAARMGLITSEKDYSNLIRNWLIELEKLIMRQRQHYVEC